MGTHEISRSLIQKRRLRCAERLTALRKAVDPKLNEEALIQGREHLCIYVTGSYGRLEASEFSDLDLFFIHDDVSSSNRFSDVSQIILKSLTIRTCHDNEFPPFSADSKYLTVHSLKNIKEKMGSPDDDFENCFTARMLLILESRSLFNDYCYNRIITSLIDSYYRDYHEHDMYFRPIFLVNDVQRFWKTLCLNYEHARYRRGESNKEKNYLHNLKLKFSRLLTCYSFIIGIISENDARTDQEAILQLVKTTPLERLEKVGRCFPDLEPYVEDALKGYEWFLDMTGKDENHVLKWIASKEIRNEAFTKARDFGGQLYHIVMKLGEGNECLRYLVI